MKTTNKIIFYFFIALISMTSFGQKNIEVINLETNEIPNEIKYSGKIKNAISWADKTGKNIVLTCETGEYENKNSENGGRDAEIFAYHYVISKKLVTQNWKIHDYIKDCPVDIEAKFIKNTLKITDLNNDGIVEIWIMYKTVCHGDVSPSDMKIIMYQSKQKFAMRGENKVKISKKESVGGKYTFDKAFNEAPKEFRNFAINLWNTNILQKW